MRKSVCSLSLMLAAGVLACLCAQAAETAAPTNAGSAGKPIDLFGNIVVAKGKGIEVKRSELDGAMVSLKAAATARGQTIPAPQLQLIEQQVLDRLIQIQLLLAKATDADKAAGKKTADAQLETIKTRLKNEEDFKRQLTAMGTTEEELTAKMKQEATAESVLERELKISVTDKEVKEFYDDNPGKFEQPEMVRASHILFGTKDPTTGQDLPDDKKAAKRKEAEDVLKRARAGEDFAKLAKEYSDDPGSKNNGGEYTFPRGQMVKPFEETAFSLKTNEISDLVTTDFGYHIIKLDEKMPSKMLELAKVAPDIKEYLRKQEIQKNQKEYQEFIDKLKKEANVTILDENLKPKESASSAVQPNAAGKK